MEVKGSKTEKNLEEALAGESQARNKYTYFASKAKKEGYVQIAKIFEETADNEKEHAKLMKLGKRALRLSQPSSEVLLPSRLSMRRDSSSCSITWKKVVCSQGTEI